jgi:hypothetical protein
MSPNDAEHELEFEEIKATTEKAWLVAFENGEEHWLAKSVCRLSVVEKNKITVPEWLIDNNDMWMLVPDPRDSK